MVREVENKCGILLCDRIESLVSSKRLIVENYDNRQLKYAKYNVRLGTEYYKERKFKNLSNDDKQLTIKPYEIVFVESYEVFKLPDDIIAKYDLRISGGLAGIGLQTGLQLDPTYHGRFFCPLFNFSDQPYSLCFKEDLASVQFSYTTTPTEAALRIEAFSEDKRDLMTLSRALHSPRSSGLLALHADIQKTRAEMEQKWTDYKSKIEEDHRSLNAAHLEAQSNNTIFLAVIGLILTAISAMFVPEAIGRAVGTSLPVVIIITSAFVIIVCAILWFIAYVFKKGHDGTRKP